MTSCDDCGKVFNFPYLLLRHLNKKYPCNPIKNICRKVNVSKCSVNDKVNDKHKCERCGKTFKNKQAKYYHKKNVECSPKVNEVEELKKEIKELKNMITTTGQTTNNNNCNNKYGVIYMLKEREFVNSGINIYKIGKTLDLEKRMSKYPKGSHLYFNVLSDDIDKDEREILNIFRHEFVQRKDIGLEYFEGEHKLMLKQLFSKLTENFHVPS